MDKENKNVQQINIELDEKLIFLSATFKGKVSEKNRIKLLMNKLLKKDLFFILFVNPT